MRLQHQYLSPDAVYALTCTCMQFPKLLYFDVVLIDNDVFCCNCIVKKYEDLHMRRFVRIFMLFRCYRWKNQYSFILLRSLMHQVKFNHGFWLLRLQYRYLSLDAFFELTCTCIQFSQLFYFDAGMIHNDVFCCNCMVNKYGDLHMGEFICFFMQSRCYHWKNQYSVIL